jgi:hypothetical protein
VWSKPGIQPEQTNRSQQNFLIREPGMIRKLRSRAGVAARAQRLLIATSRREGPKVTMP